MTVVAHLSDTHFGTEVAAVRDALLQDLHDAPPDIVVVTGDITQRARSHQFRAARAFLDAMPRVPRLVIPGNHDIPLFDALTRFARPYRLFKKYIALDIEPAYLDDTLAVLCVNATRRSRHKNGVLDETQISAARTCLSGLRQAFKLVAVHQPLAVTLETDEKNLARRASQALDEWISAGADLFLGGHIHLPYCLVVHARKIARTAIALQAGTAVSHRVRGGIPNSYNRIVLQQVGATRRMRIERRDFDLRGQKFLSNRVFDAQNEHGSWSLSASLNVSVPEGAAARNLR